MARMLAVLLLIVFMLLCEIAAAGGLLRAASRAAVRNLERQTERVTRVQQAYSRDAVRDAATPAKASQRARRVQRYTSAAEADRELRDGIPAGSHMTSNVAHGRGINGQTASERYGLTQVPQRVLTVEIPAGSTLRANKAIGGQAGRGELTSTSRIPASAVTAVRPVAPPRKTSGASDE